MEIASCMMRGATCACYLLSLPPLVGNMTYALLSSVYARAIADARTHIILKCSDQIIYLATEGSAMKTGLEASVEGYIFAVAE